MNEHRDNAAFTLIEILIALAMMATILSMMYGSYAATSQSMQSYGSRMASSERATLILRLMERQIRCAYMRPKNENADDSIRADHRDTPTDQSLSASAFQGNAQDPQGRILSFTTSGLGGESPGQSGLSRIRYRYDAITDTLWIDRRPLLEECDEADLAQSGRPVLDRIAAVNTEFYDGHKWRPTWDSAKAGTLPRAVRVSLSFVDEQDRSYELGTTVRIEAQTAMSQISVKRNLRRVGP